MVAALSFIVVIQAIGVAASPIAALALRRLPGAGLGFAKVLGLLLVTWTIWLGASLHLIAYGLEAAVIACALLAIAGLISFIRLGGHSSGVWHDPSARRMWLSSELVFLAVFCLVALLVSFSPDVWGGEKPMDMAIINATNASQWFPPHDPWLAGATINYYYFGHLVSAVMLRLTGVAPTVGYNLMLAIIFALFAATTFTFAATVALTTTARSARSAVIAGLAAVLFVLLLGNLAGAKQFFAIVGPFRHYSWFAPTRVIPNTINEYPAASIFVGELHAHVVVVPFILLALGFALQGSVVGEDERRSSPLTLLLAGLSVGICYAINTWSYPVAAAVVVVARFFSPSTWQGERALRAATEAAVIIAVSALVSLPFYLTNHPAVTGIGWVSAHEQLTDFYTHYVLIYGLFMCCLVALPWSRAGSLTRRWTWLLAVLGVGCLVVTEVVYLRDPFDGGQYYRMNTVFKFGYHAWLLLGLASALVVSSRVAWPKSVGATWLVGVVGLSAASMLYPIASATSRIATPSGPMRLDGLAWLRRIAPGDVEAITWLRRHSPPQAVVLEAAGKDYSAAGYSRISTFSGRATVLGWPGHELEWNHKTGTRADDIRQAYTTTDPEQARTLAAREKVAYVVVGPIERAEYGSAGIEKWDRIGARVFDRFSTTIWKLYTPLRR